MFTVNRKLLLQRPCFIAVISGSPKYPKIHGTVSFFKTCNGSLVVAEIFNLPCTFITERNAAETQMIRLQMQALTLTSSMRSTPFIPVISRHYSAITDMHGLPFIQIVFSRRR